MNGNDIGIFRQGSRDLSTAIALLTRLPVQSFVTQSRPAAFAAWAYPLVGILVTGIAAAVGWVVLAFGLPTSAAALLIVLTSIIVTGALHEDGLADCADGFWGGWTVSRRLEIMKDSQIGTYGVIALISALGMKWIALSALLSVANWGVAMLGAAVASRAAMVGVMYLLPNARTSGLSQQTGKPPLPAVTTAAGIGFIALLFSLTSSAVVGLVLVVLVTTGWIAIAKTKIGGQTGDVLGATQQIVEITILLVCLASLS